MAQDMFSRWDKEIDTEGLQNDIAEAATNGGNGTIKKHHMVIMKLQFSKWN